MSMISSFPTTRKHFNGEVVTYPHIARKTQADTNGLRPITTGGIIIGYWTRLEHSAFEVFDENRQRVAYASTLQVAAGRAAQLDAARLAYIETARQGVFGTQAEAWVRAAEATTVNDDDSEHNVIIGWPEWNHGNPRADVKLDGEVIGSVVLASNSFYAHNLAMGQVGFGGSMENVVRGLVSWTIQQREQAQALSVDAVTSRRDEAVQQAWVAILCAVDEQQALGMDAASYDALCAAQSALKAFGIMEGVNLSE